MAIMGVKKYETERKYGDSNIKENKKLYLKEKFDRDIVTQISL